MKQKRKQKNLPGIIVIITMGIFVVFVLFALLKKTDQSFPQTTFLEKNNTVTEHVSQDLKIVFKYPKGWYVDDRYRMILLTSYKTNLNRNDYPENNQIQIQIDDSVICKEKPDLDEQVIIGGCAAEGNWIPTKILSKKVQDLPSGTLYTYVTQHSNNPQQTQYFLQKGERILSISKQPDPSQFEKEFYEIINSIKFL